MKTFEIAQGSEIWAQISIIGVGMENRGYKKEILEVNHREPIWLKES